jgi:hypothetical protein
MKQRTATIARKNKNVRPRVEDSSLWQSLSKPFAPYISWIKWGVLVFLFAAKTYLIFNHEPWRDETVFLMFLQNSTFSNFIQEFRGYQFPSFELLTNLTYSVFGYNIITGRIITLILSLITSYLVLFHLRLPLILSIPFLLTKYCFYEYTVFINRPYAWGLLLIVIFIALTANNKPVWMRLIIAGMMIPSHAVMFIVGGGFFGYSLLSFVLPDRTFWQQKANIAALIFACLCIVLGAWALIPKPNGYNTPFEFHTISQSLLLGALILNQAFLSIAPIWWGAYTYLFTTETGLIISGFLFLGAIALFFASIRLTPSLRWEMLAIVGGIVVVVAGLSSVFIFKKYAYAMYHTSGARQVGMMYVAVLSFFWLGCMNMQKVIQFRHRMARITLISTLLTKH